MHICTYIISTSPPGDGSGHSLPHILSKFAPPPRPARSPRVEAGRLRWAVATAHPGAPAAIRLRAVSHSADGGPAQLWICGRGESPPGEERRAGHWAGHRAGPSHSAFSCASCPRTGVGRWTTGECAQVLRAPTAAKGPALARAEGDPGAPCAPSPACGCPGRRPSRCSSCASWCWCARAPRMTIPQV